MSKERKTIFFVDDDPTNLMAVRGTLEEYYDILTLNSGERLLKTLEKKTPDLILLDVEMPGMDGYETIKHLKAKEETADIPVIFLTAKNDDANELIGLTLGAVDYITKPTPPPPLLLKRIEVHLLVENQKKELMHFNSNLQTMVKEKTENVLELQRAILKTMAELVECRDNVTGGHIERTTRYLGILIDAAAKDSTYKDELATYDHDLLMQSAQLHDVGKISVPDNILQKPGKLTNEEFDKIKLHPTFGANVIDRIKESTSEKEFLNYARIFAESHHEKWDGTGYPKGLSGIGIPLLGRLMAFADVYDALVSDRPYKKAFTHEEAVKIISDGKGTHFDPQLTDLFVAINGEFDKVRIELGDSA